MPSKKLNFSLAPINDNPTSIDGAKVLNGFSHKNGFPTIKFSIPAQDVLLDVNNLYLSGQIFVSDANGNLVQNDNNLATADNASLAKFNKNNAENATDANGGNGIILNNTINKSNWNGVASVIDKVVVQSKKTQTELSTIINYSAFNALKVGHSNNEDDYQRSVLTRNMCAGINSGFTDRHLNNTPFASRSNLPTTGSKFRGQFFSFKLDVALLDAQAIHLGNDFAGGLLLTLHLTPDSAFFHQRFRTTTATTANANIQGAFYQLKNVKLEGKYALPTQQDLQMYNPVITMNSRVNLMNDLVSSENANSYTPQLRMVKGIINTFLDDNQSNNYTLNQNNFRVPVGLEQYQQAKNNIRYPNDFQTQIVPNSRSAVTAGGNVDPNLSSFPATMQGDSELRLQFGRSLLGGRLPAHSSATLDLTNQSIQGDYDASTVSSAVLMTGDNTHPDLLGIAVDYNNNIGQTQNYVNQDYELKVSSGVNTGRVNLPATRSNRVSIMESFVKNYSQIDLRTLQKTQ